MAWSRKQTILHKIEAKSALPVERGYSADENNAMLRAVLGLLSKWQLSDAQAAILLGGVATKTLQRWRAGSGNSITIDLSDRLSNLLGIHKALRILFSEPARYYGWINQKNEAFAGASALDVMLNGHLADIECVRHYLDSMRGGW